MGQLWDEIGGEYTAEYYGYPYAPKSASGESAEPCPLCKSANVKAVPDGEKGYSSRAVLAECLDCRGFYSLLTH